MVGLIILENNKHATTAANRNAGDDAGAIEAKMFDPGNRIHLR